MSLLRLAGVSREDAFRAIVHGRLCLEFHSSHRRSGPARLLPVAVALGAFLFTFGLPITQQIGHAQLVYRFGVPLAVLALIEARERKSLRKLALARFWTTWQFYCSIYVGYFLVLLFIAMVLGQALCSVWGVVAGGRSMPGDAFGAWVKQSGREKAVFLIAVCLMASAMAVLLRPYALASHVYNFQRSWPEIAAILPRPESYL